MMAKRIEAVNEIRAFHHSLFLSKIIKIDRTKAHQKFYEFIRSEQLTSIQEEYLDSILNYVCANGDMERRTLGQDPYRDFNWQQAFGDKRSRE